MDKVRITLSANEQVLTLTSPMPVVSDTVNYIEATFVLGDNWQGFDSVSAVWFNDYIKPVRTVLDPNGKCYVPHEVMTVNGNVKVNLVGSITEDDELTDRLTTAPVDAVKVYAKAMVDGTETAKVTASQFEQFVAIVIDEVEKVTGMTAQAETLPSGSQATASYDDGVLTLGIPQGEKGETGSEGRGIASVVLNADYTLTINFTDGTSMTTTSIRGANGNGIRSIAKTGTSGLVDTYTITFDDGTTTTFTVTNGEKGDTGTPAGFGTVTASVDGNVGTPSVEVTTSGTDEAKNFDFKFHNLKGEDAVIPWSDILPTDTASGQIASFPDGTDLLPAKSVSVALEPIQEGI